MILFSSLLHPHQQYSNMDPHYSQMTNDAQYYIGILKAHLTDSKGLKSGAQVFLEKVFNKDGISSWGKAYNLIENFGWYQVGESYSETLGLLVEVCPCALSELTTFLVLTVLRRRLL